MSEMLYLHLLILCSILFEGVIGTKFHGNIKESSHFLQRKKRVINLERDGRKTIPIENIPFIVEIRQNNRSKCAGTILSHYSVITAATCVELEVTAYKVQSGSGYVNHSKSHTVQSKSIYYGKLPHGQFDGIAIVSVDPPFVFNPKTGFLHLYSGPLHPGTKCTISGWGCYYRRIPTTNLERRLRSITLPIMNNEECQSSYPVHFGISQKHICTYHDQKLCAETDIGAALIVDNMLAGIHVWKGEFMTMKNPDVYINLQHSDYDSWIRSHTILM